MRGSLTTTLIIAILFAGGYLLYVAQAVCPIPLPYRLGDIDSRFTITLEEAKAVTTQAEGLWEDATGQDLFVYDDDADFVINFIFDDRQALSDAENEFKNRLDAAENVNDALVGQYETRVAEYEDLKRSYESKSDSYESVLGQYNANVNAINDAGGASPEQFTELETKKRALDATGRELNQMLQELNLAVEEINQLGNQGNQLIETYNRGVETYNQRFGEPREFTQGDYQGDEINIYTFENFDELELVLAHELGHALHLDHVEGEASIMYYLIGGQPDELMLSETDKAEFAAMCGGGFDSFMNRLGVRFGI